MLHKHALLNPNLTAKAKGIHAYIMSLPDGWKVRLRELRSHFKDGMASIRSAFDELEAAGYLVKGKGADDNADAKGNIHGNGNRFAGFAYDFFEVPSGTDSSVCRFSVYGKSDLIDNDTKKDILPEAWAPYVKFTRRWRTLHRDTNPELYPRREKDITPRELFTSARELDKVCRIDGFNWKAQVRPALLWAATDKFWSANVRSLASIRHRGRNGEHKFTNILAAWTRAGRGARTEEESTSFTPLTKQMAKALGIAPTSRLEDSCCEAYDIFKTWAKATPRSLPARDGLPRREFMAPTVPILMERWCRFMGDTQNRLREEAGGDRALGPNGIRPGSPTWERFKLSEQRYWGHPLK